MLVLVVALTIVARACAGKHLRLLEAVDAISATDISAYTDLESNATYNATEEQAEEPEEPEKSEAATTHESMQCMLTLCKCDTNQTHCFCVERDPKLRFLNFSANVSSENVKKELPPLRGCDCDDECMKSCFPSPFYARHDDYFTQMVVADFYGSTMFTAVDHAVEHGVDSNSTENADEGEWQTCFNGKSRGNSTHEADLYVKNVTNNSTDGLTDLHVTENNATVADSETAAATTSSTDFFMVAMTLVLGALVVH